VLKERRPLTYFLRNIRINGYVPKAIRGEAEKMLDEREARA
jgi:hypothetical protein